MLRWASFLQFKYYLFFKCYEQQFLGYLTCIKYCETADDITKLCAYSNSFCILIIFILIVILLRSLIREFLFFTITYLCIY